MTYPLTDSFCAKFNISKPPLPYVTDRRLIVRSHYPPPPTVGRCDLNPCTAYERESKHPLERCLLHPPLPGSDGPHTLHLRIAGVVRVGDNCAAQLVTVQVLGATPNTPDGLPTNLPLVAKIYDPLYFDHDQDDADAFLCVDRDYSHETAAYRALFKLQGTVVPKLYGSYSLELPVDKTTKRLVRLIIIELVPGTSMQELDSAHFSQVERQMIMDVHPRNVLVLGKDVSSHSRRVVLIDFGSSDVGRSRFPKDPTEEQQFLPGVRITPLLRWNALNWKGYLDVCFGAWVDWDWQTWLEYHYGSESATITDEMRSIWLPDWLTSPPGKPE